MHVYRIVDWDKNYEVNNKGRQITSYIPVEERRKGSLKYVRLKVYGLSIDPILDEIISRSWQPGSIFHWAVLGIYNKLLEIAADQEREFRGWVLDQKQKPVTPQSFAKRFREPNAMLIKKAFEILCHPDINLLEICEYPEVINRLSTEINDNRVFSRKSGRLQNHTNTTRTTQPSSRISGRNNKTKIAADRQKELLFREIED